jgi:uncharacterized protein
MGAELGHFAINADDLDEARRFYQAVFGWTFRAWGPPGFFQIDSESGPGIAAGGSDGVGAGTVAAALQTRRELLPGVRTVGFECTFSVSDVDATAKLVLDHGGKILMERTTIAGVGHLVWFADPAGNVVGAMQYDSDAE